jgi:hypothetical protein
VELLIGSDGGGVADLALGPKLKLSTRAIRERPHDECCRARDFIACVSDRLVESNNMLTLN